MRIVLVVVLVLVLDSAGFDYDYEDDDEDDALRVCRRFTQAVHPILAKPSPPSRGPRRSLAGASP